MQAILLAAGKSTRLDPLSDKNLLEFCGKTLVEHQVSLIKNAKIRDIVVVGNAENMETLKRIFKKYHNVAVTEQKALEEGMAGGVLAGAKRVSQKEILVMSTNDIVDAEALELMKNALKEKGIDGAILAKKVDQYFPGGYLKLDKKGVVETIVEKPGEGREPSPLVNLVLHIFRDFPSFVTVLRQQKGKADGRYEAALSRFVKKDKRALKAVEYRGHWLPIKYPWHVLAAMNYFLSRQKPFIDKTAQISKSAVIKGGSVYIGRNVRVLEHATIQGPAYIGDNALVANNALIRSSMIGHHSVVGFSTEIARSYLNHNVWTHSNYIGDSVVDFNVSFGAGGVVGNLRLDEEIIGVKIRDKKISTGSNKFGVVIGSGSRLGINISTMPGIKIGRGCFVGSGIIVAEDLPDRSFVRVEQKLKRAPNTKIAFVDKRNKMRDLLK
ncbi:NTP transferase domain-containing protein [Candidatus Peregrinibacteria bacterium]|nr:NTP transferase domain-containing protein [Candidatus Peregrinibacteria bacterium]